MPQQCAGMRIEPPPSLPIPPAEQKDAIAADSPPLDPPAVREVFAHGIEDCRDDAIDLTYRHMWILPLR